MRIVCQRVARASVSVHHGVVGEIGRGLLLLVGVAEGDGVAEAVAAADKIAKLRVFADSLGKMNLTVRQIGGEVLVVSQFTLLGDTSRGNRPSFIRAAPPEVAAPLIEALAERLEEEGIPTERGIFGARMTVDLVNEGPVTLILDVNDGRVG